MGLLIFELRKFPIQILNFLNFLFIIKIMKKSMNYITALPDFIEMQRVSFCWFIAYGLNEELSMFSRIHDFSYNTEYLLFGQEYSLVKPIYNIVRAKKYTANYAAQLVIPLEVRNKKLNSVRYHSISNHKFTSNDNRSDI